MANHECNKGTSANSPCQAALRTLDKLPSGETMSGRVIVCPKCNTMWRFNYYQDGGRWHYF